MAANSKRNFLHAMRRFLTDVELWGWVKLRISPRHHLATPRTVSFASRVNPRVIDDAAWLKLIWASLNIEQSDLLSEIHYPLAMLRAMAVIWTHSGLRQNKYAFLEICESGLKIIPLRTGECTHARLLWLAARRPPEERAQGPSCAGSSSEDPR